MALEQQLDRRVFSAQWEEVSIVFGSADVDFDIVTALRPPDPENIRYLVVGCDRATSLYHDQSATRRPWGVGYVVLRSSVANAVVTVVLYIPR